MRLVFNVDTSVHLQDSSEADNALYYTSSSAENDAVSVFTSNYSDSASAYISKYPDLYASSADIPTKLPADKKIVYLTFDDGPSTQTDKILDILDEHDIKATFFIMGCGVGDTGRERLKRMAASGHTIGIHTFSHDYKDIYSSVNSFLEDFSKVHKLVVDATGTYPNIFRFPGGSNNKYIGKIRDGLVTEMTRRGFTFYDWTVSAEDSVGKPTAASIKKYLSLAYKYSYPVILMHDSASNSLTASLLSEFITELKDAGYQFDTLDNRVPIQY